jgi:predicted transposase/invertase (TIGR01784 family)
MNFANPKNDVAFKKIFGDEKKTEILISFLNAVLNLSDEKEITHINILNPYQAPKLKDLKQTVLDVRATDKRGITFIVEMQVKQLEGYKKRFVYYVSQAYSSQVKPQIKRGEDYPKLNQVFFIGVLDYEEFSSKHYLSRHQLLNLETKKQDIEELEFSFIELPKFSKKEAELESILEKWIYFIKHASDLEVIPESADIEPLREAYKIANTHSWSKEELDLYNYWSMKDQDERGAMAFAVKKAAAEGHAEGHVEGHAEGKKEKAIEAAKKMLADGLTVEVIAKYTGLSLEEIATLSFDNG